MARLFRQIPLACRAVFIVFAASVFLHVGFAASQGFAEFYSRTVGAFFRSLFARLTGFLPISLGEALIIFSPAVLAWLIYLAVSRGSEREFAIKLISGLLSAVMVIYILFSITFAAGFYTRDIGVFFGIERRDITLDELYSATLICAERVNSAYEKIDGASPGSTVMELSLDELNEKLMEAAGGLSNEYGYPSKMKSRVKPVMLSVPMTYTHISGVYTFFTGEANVNVNFPDFTLPYTAAHELSHQRGVSREDEANFAAFLICLRSDEPYVVYSGYLNMYQYMASALYSASAERYFEVYGSLSDGVRRELISYSAFFDKYRDNAAANISGVVNDAYLTLMSGTDSRSYGMVVDLASLYLLEK